MAKALMGTYTTPRAEQLLDEVRALRGRIAELEAELAEAQEMARQRRSEHDDEIVVTEDALDEPVGATP